MNAFNVGDKVVIIQGGWGLKKESLTKLGVEFNKTVLTVSSYNPHTKRVNFIELPYDLVANVTGYKYYSGILVKALKKVEQQVSYPNPPHKHRDLIIAWANGAEIEFFSNMFEKWIHTRNPKWDQDIIFRIKLQLSDKEIKIKEIEEQIESLKKKVGELRDASN